MVGTCFIKDCSNNIFKDCDKATFRNGCVVVVVKVQVNNGYNNSDTGTMIAIMMTIMAAKLVIAQTVTNTTITYMDNVICFHVSRMYFSRQ